MGGSLGLRETLPLISNVKLSENYWAMKIIRDNNYF